MLVKRLLTAVILVPLVVIATLKFDSPEFFIAMVPVLVISSWEYSVLIKMKYWVAKVLYVSALVIAANYGGQWDIAEAAKKIAAKAVNGEITPENIDKKIFGDHTSLSQYPRVDLLIRTSGEVRISNFLLWDIAYSELYFCDTFWPDFDANELDIAIKNFHSRDRRFGERNGEK